MNYAYYIKETDNYLTMLDYLSFEEICFFDRLESEWKNSLENFNPIEVFPEARKLYEKQLIKEIQQCKSILQRADELEKKFNFILDNQCSSKNRWYYEIMIEGIFLLPLREGREEKIKRNVFKLNPPKTSKNGVQKCDIERAKSVPLSNILKFNHSGFAICPFHNEKTASLKYYPKTNTWYCYSGECNQGGDVIQLVMMMNKVDFISAIKKLNETF